MEKQRKEVHSEIVRYGQLQRQYGYEKALMEALAILRIVPDRAIAILALEEKLEEAAKSAEFSNSI